MGKKVASKKNDKYKRKTGKSGIKKSNASTNPDRKVPGKVGNNEHFRTKSKIRLLNLYNKKPDM